ncbi:PAS domain S-box protein [Natranaerofaba carboxydovora]|uniref:sensor domain-containing diguanylate cyclase/phosphohydrolase n=1 Tax=Natranaerofaba carboxydovora TaxID=2742683 RepID=UPI001F13DC85|nr:PAS domain S-box protein [Natranaerofaba carboxydovora]UMZ72967.1 3'3'-cGAMP-specific phosphodiesterase 2 [Natranaerofaba carboxydovora]
MASKKTDDNSFEQAILNSLKSSICLLDEKGNIEFVNSSWFDFAKENNAVIEKISEGCNYLEVCDNAKGDDKELARQAAAGIRSVIAGEKDEFELEYPCHSPSMERWFLARVTLYLNSENSSSLKVIVFHIDITKQKQGEKTLSESEEMFKSYMEKAPVGIFVADGEGRFIDVNPEACRMRGFTREELFNSKITDIIPSESWHMTREHFKKLQEEGRAEGTLKGKRKDGTTFWYDNLAVKINEDLYISFQTDVTKRIESEEKFRTLFEQNILSIYLHDFEGNIIDVNNEACSQLGYSYNELIEMTVFDFIYPRESGGNLSKDELLRLWNGMELGERTTLEDMHQRKDGSVFYVEVSTGVISYNNENVFMALVKDITARKEAEERIKYLSFYDSLTGLYNRNFLNEDMERKDTIRQLPISIIMVDLNGLKLVNDTYGHIVGDEVLKITAEILKKSCRKEETIARYGGDEFVIFLPQTNEEEVKIICDRIKNNSSNVYVREIPVSLALGWGVKNNAEKDIEEVMTEAEDNMHKQKLAEGKSVRSAVLKALLKTLEAKSYETEEHSQRMLTVAWQIGKKLGLQDTELDRLSLLITLHDIGKVNISERILVKDASLTDEEWEEIRKHPEIGYRITRATEEFSHVAKDILAHHERWDGKGYPQGLKEKEIPLLARITSIADAYDVMSNGRPYKKAMLKEEIIEEFRRCAGTQFDPELVEIFVEVLEDRGSN